MTDSFELEPSEFNSERLRLRKLKAEDAPQVFEYASDPEVSLHTLWPPHKTESFTRGFLELFTALSVLSWAIEMKNGGKLVGMALLHSFNKHHRKAEFSINLARNTWGQGLAFEASGLVLNFAFDDLQLNRVEATCMPGNRASKRLLTKLGMRFEGTMRKSHKRYDGFHDMELYASLNDDEEKVRKIEYETSAV